MLFSNAQGIRKCFKEIYIILLLTNCTGVYILNNTENMNNWDKPLINSHHEAEISAREAQNPGFEGFILTIFCLVFKVYYFNIWP